MCLSIGCLRVKAAFLNGPWWAARWPLQTPDRVCLGWNAGRGAEQRSAGHGWGWRRSAGHGWPGFWGGISRGSVDGNLGPHTPYLCHSSLSETYPRKRRPQSVAGAPQGASNTYVIIRTYISRRISSRVSRNSPGWNQVRVRRGRRSLGVKGTR